MAHIKTFQFYRNNNVIRPDSQSNKDAVTIAKEYFDTYGSKNDGEITLMRYQEGNNDPIKTIAGIYSGNGNNGHWTYLIEMDAKDYYTKSEIDSNEEVIGNALNDLNGKITVLSQFIDNTDFAIDANYIHTDNNYTTAEKNKLASLTPIQVVNSQSTGDVVLTHNPDTFYIFGSINSLTISIVASSGLPIYAGKFTASSNWGGVGLNLPSTITEATNNDTVEAGKTYEYSILDGIISVKEIA